MLLAGDLWHSTWVGLRDRFLFFFCYLNFLFSIDFVIKYSEP